MSADSDLIAGAFNAPFEYIGYLELAAHLDGLLTSLGIAAIDAIVGHSQGAAVAVELCHLRSGDPARGVGKLVLIDPPPPAGVRWLRPVTGMPNNMK